LSSEGSFIFESTGRSKYMSSFSHHTKQWKRICLSKLKEQIAEMNSVEKGENPSNDQKQ